MPYLIYENQKCNKATDNAILVEMEGESIWIPKSQIHDDSEVYGEGHSGNLIISVWIAKQKDIEDLGEEYEDGA